MSAPDYSPELAGRLAKLESAISKQRTVRFGYWSPRRARPGERSVNPYALRLDEGNWYVVGHDLDRDTTRTFKVSRIRGDIRFATRRERDFRIPADFDVEQHRIPRPWQIGEIVGRARIAVSEDTAWWVERTLSDAGTSTTGSSRPTSRTSTCSPAGCFARTAAPSRSSPSSSSTRWPRRSLDAGRRARRRRARRRRDRSGRIRAGLCRSARPAPSHRSVSACSRLSSRTCSPRAATSARPRSTLRRSPRRFSIPLEELQDHLSLLNLVNFGGGCYAVYAEHDGDIVRVEKELYGDVFRRPPKLTPLEARAIHLAMEYVGPTIAADAHTPLKRVRKKLEETFGRFDLAGTPEPRDGSAEETLVRVLSDGADKRGRRRDRVHEGRRRQPQLRLVEPYTIERELPVWRVHTWDRSVDAARTFRLDRMRSARLTDDHFDARDGFDPSYLRDPRVAHLLHSPDVARWKLERGARALTDGSAIADVPYKTEEWLLSEVLADRGETVVLEPQRLRDVVAKRLGASSASSAGFPADADPHLDVTRVRRGPARRLAVLLCRAYCCRTSEQRSAT